MFRVEGDEHPPIRIQKLRLKNYSTRNRQLSITFYAELVLGINHEDSQRYVVTSWDAESKALFATNAYHPDFGQNVAFATSCPPPSSFTGNRTEFIGRNGTLHAPAALKRTRLSNNVGASLDPCAALQIHVELHPGEQTEVYFFFGETTHPKEARDLIAKYRYNSNVDESLKKTREWWDNLLTSIQVETPDKATNLLFNRWLLYQNLGCRLWARSAFYQSGGAFGFRDQLQDACTLVYTLPHITREQILRAASRQYVEGDVQHWWHPQSGAGVRTRISDDLLWLPYVTSFYIQITGDENILNESVHFIEGKVLEEKEHEIFLQATISKEQAPLLEHCKRAINKSLAIGAHGLPLIGAGDWNDGMNWVGCEGRGESVWLGWFLIHVLNHFAPLLSERGDNETAQKYRQHSEALFKAIENHAWDGEWYVRAFYDDGTPIGSKENVEDQIDSLAQSWALISGVGNGERAKLAMDSVEKYLIRQRERLVLLFTPPFDKTSKNPGYIKGYPPGVRENGGQYTHAAVWVAEAYAQLGEGDNAVNVLEILNPINRTQSLEDINKYKVEPYVSVADVYSLKGQVGRGGWTWYTGSAGVMYRVWLENIFGFKLNNNRLEITPCIPSDWPQITLHYRYQKTPYTVIIENPNRVRKGVIKVTLDGQEIGDKIVILNNDEKPHTIQILMG